jgi:hypothetical protein
MTLRGGNVRPFMRQLLSAVQRLSMVISTTKVLPLKKSFDAP